MKTIPLYRVNAFTQRSFGGNPAAVCLVSEWPAAELMQRIAAENDVSETAFVRRRGNGAQLRWFSPTHEVDLCGHATLAAAFVIFTRVEPGRREIRFETRGGTLDVRLGEASSLRLTLPAYAPAHVPDPPADLLAGLGVHAATTLHAVKNFYVVLEDEAAVRALEPRMDRLARLHPNGVSVSAPGTDVDFVSRYFAPSYGIPEDPVSGHPHCALVPYWSRRLGVVRLRTRQLSARGGELQCELEGDRVAVAGHAVLHAAGEIHIDDRPTGRDR